MLIKFLFLSLLLLVSCSEEKHFFVECFEKSSKKLGSKERLEKCLYLYDAGEDRNLTKVLKVEKWPTRK